MPDFNPSSFDLPVAEIIHAVKKSLSTTPTLIIQAPPGAGKSTLLPLALLNEPWLAGKKILFWNRAAWQPKVLHNEWQTCLEKSWAKQWATGFALIPVLVLPHDWK